MPTSRACLAEFIGSFALMFVGGGAIIVTSGGNLVVIALAHGLILAVMISATMHISGGQINPVVSIALALAGRQPWPRAGAFVAVQIVGATVAAFLLMLLMSGAYDVDIVKLGATLGALTEAGSEHASAIGAVALEAIATFFLMFVVMGTAVDQRGVGGTSAVGGFAVGLSLAAAILCIGPLTGASLNPARSLAPALVAGAWDFHWVYWVGPIVGAALAALAYQFTFAEKTD